MDWNLSSGSKASSKLMVTMRNETNSMPANNSMPAIFYPRSNIPGLEDHNSGGLLYGGFEGSDQESVDVDVSDPEALHPVEKKRRLSVEQVRSLELNFEIENKLEPERKKQLAHELGLQPRQVAVWFQNRRARWKTKQLERDYEALKSSYDNLVLENKRLQAEVTGLVAKLEAKVPASKEEGVTKLDMVTQLSEERQEDAVTVTKKDLMEVVASSKPAKAGAPTDKEGSPCSDGYTSEILDAEYPVEAVPIVEENILTFEVRDPQHQFAPSSAAVLTSAAAANVVMDSDSPAKAVLKDEPDGMVYDPHSNQLVLYKFEDGLVYNEYDNSYCYSPDGIGPWWT